MNYKFEITKGTPGYSWRLKAPNGETVLSSEAYTTLKGCEQSIAAAHIHATNPSQYEKRQGNGGYSFLLKATNGEVLARSQTYTTEQNRNKAILQITNGIGIIPEPTAERLVSMTLIEFVKERRKKAGLSQGELAEKAGVGIRFLRELEQGKETLRLDKINQVLKLFGHEMRPAPVSSEPDNI